MLAGFTSFLGHSFYASLHEKDIEHHDEKHKGKHKHHDGKHKEKKQKREQSMSDGIPPETDNGSANNNSSDAGQTTKANFFCYLIPW
jgi:hypothetical protein